MMDEASTNDNYLVISGPNEWSLALSCSAFGLDAEGVCLVYHVTRGLVQLGPKGTDPERCMILANGRTDNQYAWSLIDYRTPVSDADLQERLEALRASLPSDQVRGTVKVESTKDLSYRDDAWR